MDRDKNNSHMIAKFKVGDRVRVVNYGHPVWCSKPLDGGFENLPVIRDYEDGAMLDLFPNYVGNIDVVGSVSEPHNGLGYRYSLTKSAWYNEEQLELVK